MEEVQNGVSISKLIYFQLDGRMVGKAIQNGKAAKKYLVNDVYVINDSLR